MVTYVQLQAEPVWHAQVVPPALAGLKARLQAAGITTYIEGDENHLKGRHRSRRWCEVSRYCTLRSYGTTDPRDRRGSADWYRAADAMLEGPPLWDACRRMDAAVRAGRLPGVAEWFGSVDGREVVGWYEGGPATSDRSHLSHLHVGFWTEAADDGALMDAVCGIITGAEGDSNMVIYQLPDGSAWLSDGFRRRLLRSPGRIQSAIPATRVVLTDARLSSPGSAADTWDTYLDAVAGPVWQPGAGADPEAVRRAVAEALAGVDADTGAVARAVADTLAARLKD